jgi:hypothetical protein
VKEVNLARNGRWEIYTKFLSQNLKARDCMGYLDIARSLKFKRFLKKW